MQTLILTNAYVLPSRPGQPASDQGESESPLADFADVLKEGTEKSTGAASEFMGANLPSTTALVGMVPVLPEQAAAGREQETALLADSPVDSALAGRIIEVGSAGSFLATGALDAAMGETSPAAIGASNGQIGLAGTATPQTVSDDFLPSPAAGLPPSPESASMAQGDSTATGAKWMGSIASALGGMHPLGGFGPPTDGGDQAVSGRKSRPGDLGQAGIGGVVSAVLGEQGPQDPVPLSRGASGAELRWQANALLQAEADPVAEGPALTLSQTPGSTSPTNLLQGQSLQALQWGQVAAEGENQLFPSVVDQRMDGLSFGAFATFSANGVSDTLPRSAAASVSLQDLPRLVAGLSGTLTQQTDGKVEIALSPEELGHVRLTMQVDGQDPNRMIIALIFERQDALEMFRRNADQLLDAMRSAGFSGADISFGCSSGERSHTGIDQNDTIPPMTEDGDPELARTEASRIQPTKIVSTGSLDLRI